MNKLLALFLIILSFNLTGQTIDTVNLQKYFGDFTGGFCIYDLQADKYIQYNPAHCNKRFSPCSTFKIPNSLIGLETGAIADTGFIIKYDSILHPKDPSMMEKMPFIYWFQDLSLKQAFKYSCVWYYQELARRVGQENMNKHIEYLNYGNNNISGGLDKYWLCSTLEISINEQIDFLKRFYLHELKGFSNSTIDAVKSIMLYETTASYELYGKTGGGDCWGDKIIGWYVGFVETPTGTKLFAMNVLVNSFDDLKDNYRIELTKKILNELGIL